MTDLIERHLLKLRARDHVSAEEERVIRGLVSHTIEVPADRTFVRGGQERTLTIQLGTRPETQATQNCR